MKKIVVAGIVSGTVFLLFSCGGNSQQVQQQPLPAYPTAVVQKEDVTLHSFYPVNIRGQADVEVRPRVDGFIDDIYITEGSKVSKGQSLFKINSPQSEASLATAKAAITNAEAQLRTAELNVTRMRPLAEKEIISRVQLQTYENQFESAKAALETAQANLVQAQAMVDWANVISPIDGVAGSIPYREGNLVNSTVTLTTIADTRNVYAYFSMNEKEYLALMNRLDGSNNREKISNLPEVELTLANGTVYPEKGKIEAIADVVDNITGTVSLRASFPNPDGILRSGTSGRLSLGRVERDVFRVPQKATTSLQDKVMVYKVQGDSVVRTIIDVLSTADGQDYAVFSGLNEGDRIVTDGIITLYPGRKIRPE